MKSLYRRYRPLKLDDVVGQEQVTKPLKSALEKGRIAHAYLFVGPRGCGKTSVARILAHEVNGFKYELEDDYVDIIEIDGASNRGIDNIRELREKVTIAPSSGKYKVYIIDEVHMLTNEAFNALLKTLEEPPAHVIFIMATTNVYKVPVTIASRSQTYTFTLTSADVMLDYLRKICKQEGINITDEALSIVVKRGEGSFRDSLSLLDQISTLSNDEITRDLVISAFGLPKKEQISIILHDYATGDVAKIAASLKDILSVGIKPETLAEEIINNIIDEPKPELLPLLARLPDVKAPCPEAKLLVALTARAMTEPVSLKASRGVSNAPSAVSHHRSSAPDRFENNDSNFSVSDKTETIEPSGESGTATSKSDRVVHNDFDWDSFIDKVRGLSEAIYSQLVKTKYEYVDGTLNIYPMKNVVRNILARENNKRILVSAANGVKITIHEADESPSNEKKDEVLSRISGIMGGEVINDGGGSPF